MGMGRAAGWVSGLAGVPLVAWVKVLDEPGGGGAAWAALRGQRVRAVRRA